MTAPHSINAERAILGACAADKGASLEAVRYVGPADFFDPRHRVLFDLIHDSALNGEPVEFSNWLTCLEGSHRMEDAGGFAYVSDLVREQPDPGNVAYYCAVVKDFAIKRGVYDLAVNLQLTAGTAASGADLVAKTSADLAGILGAHDDGGAEIGTVLTDHYTALASGVTVPTVSLSRWPTLDRLIGGAEPGELVVIGAGSSVGKTALALNAVADAILADPPKSVLYITAEMPRRSLGLRIVQQETSIAPRRQRAGLLDRWEMQAVEETRDRYRGAPLVINEHARSLPEVRTAARARQLRKGLDVVVIDFLQLLNPGERTRSDEECVGKVAYGLKYLATDLGVVVIALSQLSREYDHRPADKEYPFAIPRKSDLRSSGKIEQAADSIILLGRKVVGEPEEIKRGLAVIDKNRMGGTGSVPMAFDPAFTLWREA